VYDNGSTDNTVSLAEQFNNVRVKKGPWEGFGKTKKAATLLAKTDWILSLDADEAIDNELKKTVLALVLSNPNEVFELKFKNFFGNKHLKHGEWGGDKHIRLFNRRVVGWNEAPVHEQLVMPENVVVTQLRGHVLHRTAKNEKEYLQKMTSYAMLSAEKYHQQGRRSSWLRMRIAPVFSFISNYVFKLGFLDGHAGYICARITGYYTFLKYAKLKELNDRATTDHG
jgi:glycosyltransferase involved in cell wall biosynthesis